MRCELEGLEYCAKENASLNNSLQMFFVVLSIRYRDAPYAPSKLNSKDTEEESEPEGEAKVCIT